jgi:hypothetical protein
VSEYSEAALYELLQEIKALRSDLEKLPEQITKKLGAVIEHELKMATIYVLVALTLNWLYQHFLK